MRGAPLRASAVVWHRAAQNTSSARSYLYYIAAGDARGRRCIPPPPARRPPQPVVRTFLRPRRSHCPAGCVPEARQWYRTEECQRPRGAMQRMGAACAVCPRYESSSLTLAPHRAVPPGPEPEPEPEPQPEPEPEPATTPEPEETAPQPEPAPSAVEGSAANAAEAKPEAAADASAKLPPPVPAPADDAFTLGRLQQLSIRPAQPMAVRVCPAKSKPLPRLHGPTQLLSRHPPPWMAARRACSRRRSAAGTGRGCLARWRGALRQWARFLVWQRKQSARSAYSFVLFLRLKTSPAPRALLCQWRCPIGRRGHSCEAHSV